MRRLSALTLCVALVSSCGGDESGTLFVDVTTDYVAGQEFANVRTSLFAALPEAGETPLAVLTHTVAFGEDFIGGQRVAEFSVVGAGSTALLTELLRADGTSVARRRSLVQLTGGNVGVTVPVSRDCDGVICPQAEAPAATECFGGACVTPECIVENSAACGPTMCTEDSQCPTSVPCARGRCVAGACLTEGVASMCAPGEYCEPTMGCLPREMPDAALDAGVDAMDAAPDAPDAAPVLGAQGDPCTSSPECGTDLACAPFGGVSTCEPLCTTNVDCGEGTCREGSPIGPMGICTSVCDPVEQTGCPAGQFCHFFISFLQENADMIPATTCGANFGMPQGSACGSGMAQCGPGMFCINDECVEMCSLTSPSCTAGYNCRLLGGAFPLRGEDTMWCMPL